MNGLLRRNLALVVVLIVYLCLGSLYLTASPIFEPSDEYWHYAFVQHLADGKGLPVLDTTLQQHQVRQEVAQPPLYYLLVAPIAMLVPNRQDTSEFVRNPQVGMGTPYNGASNRNAIVHRSETEVPWQGTPLAVCLIRAFSLVLTSSVIVASYIMALKFSSGNRWCATTAAMLVAFNPQFIFFSASVNNDNLMNALGAVTMATLICGLSERAGCRFPLALGLLTGLAVLTKPSALALLPVVLVGLAWIAWRQRSVRRLLRDAALYITPVIVLSGWWFVRNAILYNDPLALTVHAAFGVRTPAIGALEMMMSEAEGMWHSYWAVFGVFDVLAPPNFYIVFDAIGILAAIGLLIGFGRLVVCHLKGKRDIAGFVESPRTVGMLLSVLWCALVGVALVKWSLMVPASQGRLLFPALASAAALMAIGLRQYPFPRRALGSAVGIVLLIVAISLPFTTITPAYAKPPLVPIAQLEPVPNPIHTSFDGKFELVGYSLDRSWLKPGENLRLTLYWNTLEEMTKDYSTYVHAFGADGQLIASDDFYPGQGAFLTSDLLPGQSFSHTVTLTISKDSTAPAMGHIEVGLYDLSTFERVPAFDGQGKPVAYAPCGRFHVGLAQPPAYTPQIRLNQTLGGQIELSGVDIPQFNVDKGGALRLTAYWKALRVPDNDYVVFAQLMGPEGLTAQYDAQPLSNGLPFSTWGVGETIQDTFEIPIPSDAKSGPRTLIIGLYDLTSGGRLQVDNSDHVELGSVFIR